jgi:hypothetical protein
MKREKGFREAYKYDSKSRFEQEWMIGNKERIRG